MNIHHAVDVEKMIISYENDQHLINSKNDYFLVFTLN